VERNPSGWSDPQPVSPVVNTMQLHWSVSVSENGTLYFGGSGPDGKYFFFHSDGIYWMNAGFIEKLK